MSMPQLIDMRVLFDGFAKYGYFLEVVSHFDSLTLSVEILSLMLSGVAIVTDVTITARLPAAAILYIALHFEIHFLRN